MDYIPTSTMLDMIIYPAAAASANHLHYDIIYSILGSRIGVYTNMLRFYVAIAMRIHPSLTKYMNLNHTNR